MTNICYPELTPLISAEQAKAHLSRTIKPLDDHETIPLPQALGRILASDVYSRINIPPQRNAAMDGYAFASCDLADTSPTHLKLAGHSWAGKPFTGKTRQGQCVRIFTGAVVPEFADSVIAQEQISLVGEMIEIPVGTKTGTNIRGVGSDVEQNQRLITAGKRLSAIDLGLLASAGLNAIEVKRRIRIGIFATGDELITAEHPLDNGKIYDSNRPMLTALLKDANHQIVDLGIISDDAAVLEQTLMDAANCFDVIISTGGASVGEADYVKSILEKCGKIEFWKLAIKPGKPLAFGKIGFCNYFGLPGNPVAVLVTCEQFVKPALRKLAGEYNADGSLQLMARCESRLRKSPGRQEYQRGILRQIAPGQFSVIAAGQQDSHQLKVASMANCFIILEAARSNIEIGEMVLVEPFSTHL